MAATKMARNAAQIWQQGIHRAHQLDERAHGWLGMLAGAARQALKPGSVITAAAIAYFAIFSLFPLTLLSIAIASFSLGPLVDQRLIIQRLEFIVPGLGLLCSRPNTPLRYFQKDTKIFINMMLIITPEEVTFP
jgi:hypothetical protein